MEEPEPPDPRALVGSAFVFYTVMTLLGLGLMYMKADVGMGERIFGSGEHVLRDTALGAGTGLAVVAISWALSGWGPLQRLNRDLSKLVRELDTGSIALLALTSSVGEEVLFRGGLQPLLGFWLTAFAFAIVHGGTSSRFRVWVVFALLAGLLLGWLARYTGNLLAPFLCHLTVNYFNLHLLSGEHE